MLVYAEGGGPGPAVSVSMKPGIGRIALDSGVPVVPVAIHGSASVRKWKRLVLPKVTVQFGEPMTFPVIENATQSSSSTARRKSSIRSRRCTRPRREGRRGVKQALREKVKAPEPGRTIVPRSLGGGLVGPPPRPETSSESPPAPPDVSG